MLEYLHIQNVGIVEELSIEFNKEVTIFTGETGAGKSIILSSLLLLLGEKASSTTVRHGAEQAVITSTWNTTGLQELEQWLHNREITLQDNELNVRRIVKGNGRSQCFIEGQVLSLKELSECMEFLCEIHTQHEHQSLFRGGAQLQIIDRYAGINARVIAFSKMLSDYKRKEKEYKDSITNEQSRLRELDYLRYAVKEIADAKLKKGEDEDIIEELKQATNLEEILQLWKNIDRAFFEDEGVLSLFKEVGTDIETLSGLQPSIAPIYERLNAVLIELDDIADELSHQKDSLNELDQDSINKLEQRLSLIEGLKKKYGNTLEKVTLFLDDASQKITRLENLVENKEEVKAQLIKEYAAIKKEAEALSQIRVQATVKFSAEINDILHKLAMEKATFSINITQTEEIRTTSGIDELEFFIASNVGELSHPLVKIVSGGELSRVMLAIKIISSKNEALHTLVLDEVDAGIGGKTANILAEYLKSLGTNTQVLCVTHLPIIAACAKNHYIVEKIIDNNRTKVNIQLLQGKQRIQELARMLVGNPNDALAQSQAQQMLQEFKNTSEGLF